MAINDDLDMDVNFLFECLASEVRRGARFGAGQTVQVGWMILMFKANRQGGLELWEPDFQSMPIEWVFSLNRTMWHIFKQKEACAQICAEADFPSLLQSGFASQAFLSGLEFSMSRESTNDADSGWLFAKYDDQSVESKYCSLYEIAVNNPRVIPFLALLTDSVVQSSSNGLEVRIGSGAIDSCGSDFLRRLDASWLSGGDEVV